MSALKVGDVAVHVERLMHGFSPRKICQVTIVRETKTQWVDARGNRWRKSDGSLVPQYICPRFLMSVADFAAEISARAGDGRGGA